MHFQHGGIDLYSLDASVLEFSRELVVKKISRMFV